MKKTATPNESSRKRDAIHDTSATAQQQRLLVRLQRGPVDTLLARRELNILMPAARIKELRNQGHEIHAQYITITDEQGHTHRGIALYTLIRPSDAGRADA
jgi:hypothetical protein